MLSYMLVHLLPRSSGSNWNGMSFGTQWLVKFRPTYLLVPWDSVPSLSVPSVVNAASLAASVQASAALTRLGSSSVPQS